MCDLQGQGGGGVLSDVHKILKHRLCFFELLIVPEAKPGGSIAALRRIS